MKTSPLEADFYLHYRQEFRKLIIKYILSSPFARTGSYSQVELLLINILHDEGSLSRKEIAARLEPLDEFQVSRLVNGLKETGLLTIVADAEDRRRKHLKLSPRGRRVARDLARQFNDKAGELLSPLTPLERRQLLAALQTVNRLRGKIAAVPEQVFQPWRQKGA